jgi:ATP P2X receptor
MIKLDWDNILSYSTSRYVVIRDAKLGILYYTLWLAIIGYTLGFNIIYQQRYRLHAEDVVGNTRLQLQTPTRPYWSWPNQTLYCCQNQNLSCSSASLPASNPLAVEFLQLPCHYLDQYDSVFPETEPGAMLLSTRITEINQVLNPSCTVDFFYPTCEYESISNRSYFVGNVEFSTLLIDHAMSSPTLGISETSYNMNGKILDLNGNLLNPCDDYTALNLTCPSYISLGNYDNNDIIPIQTLLRAAGIGSLEEVSGNIDESFSTSTKRMTGIVLVIQIVYSNYFVVTSSWSQNTFSYTYNVRVIDNSEFKSEQVLPGADADGTVRKVIDRHGIRIIVKQSGDVGIFDSATLLITITASLGLVAVATIIVNYLALWFMPLRKLYRRFMYHQTPKLSELQSDREQIEQYIEQEESKEAITPQFSSDRSPYDEARLPFLQSTNSASSNKGRLFPTLPSSPESTAYRSPN